MIYRTNGDSNNIFADWQVFCFNGFWDPLLVDGRSFSNKCERNDDGFLFYHWSYRGSHSSVFIRRGKWILNKSFIMKIEQTIKRGIDNFRAAQLIRHSLTSSLLVLASLLVYYVLCYLRPITPLSQQTFKRQLNWKSK